MHAAAWDAALADSAEAPPMPYAWADQGRPLSASEGRGGAPWSWLLRSRDLRWELLAASRSKAWLRFEGTVRFASGLEEANVDAGMARRARREERRRVQEGAVRGPTQRWVVEYQAGVDRLREGGVSEAEAHRLMAWSAGENWVRQLGDNNYYGYGDCLACDMDGPCDLCMFADGYDSTPRNLLIPANNWLMEEDENPYGTREWEAQVLEAYGLLDSAEDPERWPGVGGEAAGAQVGQNGAGNGQHNNQGLQLDSDESEDDVLSEDDLPNEWGEPGPTDPNWV